MDFTCQVFFECEMGVVCAVHHFYRFLPLRRKMSEGAPAAAGTSSGLLTLLGVRLRQGMNTGLSHVTR